MRSYSSVNRRISQEAPTVPFFPGSRSEVMFVLLKELSGSSLNPVPSWPCFMGPAWPGHNSQHPTKQIFWMRAQHLLTPETEGPCWERWGCAGCGSSSSPSPVGAAPGLCSAPCSERPQPAAPSSSPFLRCEARRARVRAGAGREASPHSQPSPCGAGGLATCSRLQRGFFSHHVFFKGVLFSCRAALPGARGGDSCAWCHLPGGVSAARAVVAVQSWPYSPRCWGERVAKAEASTQVGL